MGLEDVLEFGNLSLNIHNGKFEWKITIRSIHMLR